MRAIIHDYLKPVASPNGQSTAETMPISYQGWRRWFHWEALTVSGREVKGFVIPQWAAGVILAAIIGAFGFMYSQNQTQKEMLIRLDQKLQDKDERDKERVERVELAALKSEAAARDAIKELAILKGMLGATNQHTLERLTKN